MDAVLLAQQLIKYAENPNQIKDFLVSHLKSLGLSVQVGIGKSAPDDIFASIGSQEKHLLLCGYYDVLPVKSKEWSKSPFSGNIVSNQLYGRGITSLGSLSCALCALEDVLSQHSNVHISLYLSSKGARALHSMNNTTMQALLQKSTPVDTCLSIMPQANKELGETISIGAKGCVIFQIKSFAVSGNPSSQSERANPLHNMVDFLFKVKTYPIDNGNENFGSSTLQILSLESNYSKEDELPESVTATIGVYYNSGHTKEEIVEWMRKNMVFSRGQFEMSYRYGPESYISKSDNASEILQLSLRKVLGNNPSLKGDSIPTFAWRMGHILPMLGLGLPSNKMHCCDEAVRLEDLTHLTEVYKDFLEQYFN